MDIRTTNRGFDLIKLSLAFEEFECVWFGVDSANPLILAKDARKRGVLTDRTTGWVPYDLIPDEVMLHTRMHLTQAQVRELLPYLIKFAETGELR